MPTRQPLSTCAGSCRLRSSTYRASFSNPSSHLRRHINACGFVAPSSTTAAVHAAFMTCCCWLTDHIRLADNARKLYGHDNHPHPSFQDSAIQTSPLRTAHHLAAVPSLHAAPPSSKPEPEPHPKLLKTPSAASFKYQLRVMAQKGYVPPDCSRCNCGCAHLRLNTAATAAAVVPEFGS